MKFEEFSQQVELDIKVHFGQKAKVSLNQVTKNNGVVLSGITIMESGKHVTPTIYINDYFEKYRAGMQMENIVGEILETYHAHRSKKQTAVQFFTNYEEAGKKIVYKLINKEKNRELLQDIPYVEYLDLAIVFYCLVRETEFGDATILIHNSHLEMWNTTTEAIYENAKKNTPHYLPAELNSMQNVLNELLSEQEMPQEEFQDVVNKETESFSPMYILTNRLKIFGAAAILYPDVLKDFAKACGNHFFIIPSSVHEVILIPESNMERGLELNEMVKEINETQVPIEEVLADHVYFFHSDTGECRMIPAE